MLLGLYSQELRQGLEPTRSANSVARKGTGRPLIPGTGANWLWTQGQLEVE